MLQSIEPDLANDRAIGPVDVGRGTYSGLCEFITFLPTERIVIGRYCSIATGTTIMSGGQHDSRLPSTWPFDNFLAGLPNPTRSYRKIEDTIIGSDVWVGHGAHIGNGAKVGHGAIIGSRAVVTADVPPYAVVVGNRGEVHKMRFNECTVEALLKIEWWNWDADTIAARKEAFYGPVEAFVERYA